MATPVTPGLPNVTPNVNIQNPTVRRYARFVLDAIGAFLVIALAVDAATAAFDLLWLTTPVLAGFYAARTVFGFAVDGPNTPPSNGPTAVVTVQPAPDSEGHGQ